MNNFSVLALDSIQWGPTQIGLLDQAVGVVDILIQGVLLYLLRIGERGDRHRGADVRLAALAIVASIFAQPWVFIVGVSCWLPAVPQAALMRDVERRRR